MKRPAAEQSDAEQSDAEQSDEQLVAALEEARRAYRALVRSIRREYLLWQVVIGLAAWLWTPFALWALLVQRPDGWAEFRRRYDDLPMFKRWLFRHLSTGALGYPVRAVDAAMGPPVPVRPKWAGEGDL